MVMEGGSGDGWSGFRRWRRRLKEQKEGRSEEAEGSREEEKEKKKEEEEWQVGAGRVVSDRSGECRRAGKWWRCGRDGRVVVGRGEQEGAAMEGRAARRRHSGESLVRKPWTTCSGRLRHQRDEARAPTTPPDPAGRASDTRGSPPSGSHRGWPPRGCSQAGSRTSHGCARGSRAPAAWPQ